MPNPVAINRLENYNKSLLSLNSDDSEKYKTWLKINCNVQAYYSRFALKCNMFKWRYLFANPELNAAVYKARYEHGSVIIGYTYTDIKTLSTYVGLSSPYSSCDGEYRDVILPYNPNYMMLWIYNPSLYPGYLIKIRTLIELKNMVFGLIRDGVISINILNPADEINTLCEQIFAIYLATMFNPFNYNKNKSINIAHMSEPHKKFFTYALKSPKFAGILEHIHKAYNKLECGVDRMTLITSYNDKFSTGQKLIPLTIHDVNSKFNLDLSPWKELYIGKYVTNLVINKISHNFPILINHEIIDMDDSIMLYSNDTLIEKYTLSKFIMDKIPTEKCPAVLLHPTKSLLIIYEHVDITFDVLFRADLNYATKHIEPIIFGVLYGLLVLHNHGIVHGDLHLNNVTFYRQKFKADFHVAYVIDGENETYVLPFPNGTPMIIDFSRAILGPKHFSHRKGYHDWTLKIRQGVLMRKSLSESFLVQDDIIKLDEETIINNHDAYYNLMRYMDVHKFTGKLMSFSKKMVMNFIKDSFIVDKKRTKPIEPTYAIMKKFFSKYTKIDEDVVLAEIYGLHNKRKYDFYDIDKFPAFINIEHSKIKNEKELEILYKKDKERHELSFL
jgi:hypothetical protein